MGVMDKVKGWLFGKHEEKEMKASPEPPMQQPGRIIYEEEGARTEPPEIDEYVDIEFKKPAAPEAHSTTPMEGTTMVKKKTTRKKTAKKRTTKRKTTKRKTTKKKTTKRKTTKKKTTKRKTTKKKTTKRKTTTRKKTTKRKTTRRKTTKKK